MFRSLLALLLLASPWVSLSNGYRYRLIKQEGDLREVDIAHARKDGSTGSAVLSIDCRKRSVKVTQAWKPIEAGSMIEQVSKEVCHK